MKIPLFVFVATFMLLAATDISARSPVDEHYDRLDGEFEYDDSNNQWKEQASPVPPVSMDALQQLKIDHGPPGVTFYIDQKSIRMNSADRLTRYWLAAKSGGRVVSLNYEALRCSTREYKQIAYASPTKPASIRQNKAAKWRKIQSMQDKDHHAELATDYICAGSTPKTYEGVVSSLRGNYKSHNPYSEYTDL
jgi:hypothetical protein